MSDTLANPENVTTSAGLGDAITATASPRPWRVEPILRAITDIRGDVVANNLGLSDAALIVEAVNYYKPDLHCDWRELTPEEAVAHCREVATRLGDTPCARDHLQLAAWIEERDRLRDELDAERSQHATDIEQAEYHAEHHRKRLEAERDRLRDIVRRLADVAEDYASLLLSAGERDAGIMDSVSGIVAEARAAIGEGDCK